ncbi:MAG: sigma-70 family RNA polymerase sigma factor [Verrucomicrobiae bacterium]|nr:sigma-70 family RNA polymerase sigma factor [Verrucomicrobiae bacterium]
MSVLIQCRPVHPVPWIDESSRHARTNLQNLSPAPFMPSTTNFQDHSFPETRWSLVVEARGKDVGAALGELCRLYWKPLYGLARREGLSPEDAEDITQEFFRRLVEDSETFLAKIDPEHWRLRTFLITTLRRRIIDWRRTQMREKRGGGRRALALEELEPYLVAVRGNRSPDEEFDRHWAAAVLELASTRLARDYAASGRDAHFVVLQPFLGITPATRDSADYADVEKAMGVSPTTARQSVHRFRQRFRIMLRAEIADTLQFPTEEAIDEELRHLQASLRSS